MLKRVFYIILILLFYSSHITIASNYNNNDIVGEVLETDIAAFIDEQPIESFNINGNTYVIAEQLNNYGFDVIWNIELWSLFIIRNNTKEFKSLHAVKVNKLKKNIVVGKKLYNIIKSYVKTYLDNNIIDSYNIDGQTVICIDTLAEFGTIDWNEKNRQIKIDMLYKHLQDKFNAADKERLIIYNDGLVGKNRTSSGDANIIDGWYFGSMQQGIENGIGEKHIQFDTSISSWKSGYTTNYFGEWNDGLKSGVGIYTISSYEKYGNNSSIFRGAYSFGMENGTGIRMDTGTGKRQFDNNRYEGKWKDGKLSGFVRNGFNDSRFLYGYRVVYEGEWNDNNTNGHGKKYCIATGKLFYEGEFIKGQRDGYGTIYDNGGNEEYSCNWVNDVPIGYSSDDGKLYDNNGRMSYKGQITNGKPEGYGESYNYMYSEENPIITYKGEWKNGIREGYGISFDSYDGSKLFEGEWKNGSPVTQ